MNAVITAIRDKDWVALIQEQRSSGLTVKQSGFRCPISRRMYAATHIVVIWQNQV